VRMVLSPIGKSIIISSKLIFEMIIQILGITVALLVHFGATEIPLGVKMIHKQRESDLRSHNSVTAFPVLHGVSTLPCLIVT
jgi:hypothetical protein